jgi:hypothetical protein
MSPTIAYATLERNQNNSEKGTHPAKRLEWFPEKEGNLEET